ncbi:hypothetical protein DBR42_01640 [Pelomonas sp. HMWF004]|nr:hypothetical protein DBR42_01640 [Pelomonas sp. HMWF004]
MFLLLIGWALVLLLLALWSVLVMAAQALLSAALTHAGALGSGDWALPEVLTAWLPVPMAEWLAGTVETLTPQLQWLAGLLPSLAGATTLLAWVVWGLGALLLLLVGVAGHVAVALWRKSAASGAPRAMAA